MKWPEPYRMAYFPADREGWNNAPLPVAFSLGYHFGL